MIGKAKFLDNAEEVEEAEKLSLDAVAHKYSFDVFGFDLKSVEAFHKTDEGEIRIWMKSGKSWTLEYSEKIWDGLTIQFDINDL